MSHLEHPSLTKTCSACGMQKSLSAFLEASGPQGTTYGSICSTCRKTGMENPVDVKADDEGAPTEFTHKLKHKMDAKTKIFGEVDKRQSREKQEELYKEERKEEDIISEEKMEVKETIARNEKDHRRNFLENPLFMVAAKKAETKRAIETKQKTEKATKQYIQKEIELKEERLTNTVDETGPVDGRVKYQSATFSQYKAWLGASSPLVRQAEQARLQAEGVKKSALTKEKSTDILTEYIEKTWGPSSKR